MAENVLEQKTDVNRFLPLPFLQSLWLQGVSRLVALIRFSFFFSSLHESTRFFLVKKKSI